MTDEERIARLQKTLDYGGGTHTIDDLVELYHQGKILWWNHGDGSIITEILEFPQLKACNYWLITGVLPDCLALDAEISAWAISEGCDVATASGRKGWGRVAAPYGWRPHMQTFWKPLLRELPNVRRG